MHLIFRGTQDFYKKNGNHFICKDDIRVTIQSYKKLREQLTKELLNNFPFPIYDSLYYLPRQGRHYWYVTEKLFDKICKKNSNLRCLSKKFHNLPPNKEELSIDDFNEYSKLYYFQSEYNLRPSTKTKTSSKKKLNNFFKYLICKSTIPRIIVCGSHIRPLTLCDMFCDYEWQFDCEKTGVGEFLAIAKTVQKNNLILVLVNNLSGAISDEYLDRIREKIWEHINKTS